MCDAVFKAKSAPAITGKHAIILSLPRLSQSIETHSAEKHAGTTQTHRCLCMLVESTQSDEAHLFGMSTAPPSDTFSEKNEMANQRTHRSTRTQSLT